ncbi:PhzF family phenazine biosynthesis protein [Novosphingobium sp. RD2P27]|uniref:PhzF family phenazine biosynthesis protein n=1 Tax=Novosphingobium kalidii TaxID=3230299 RepID=A0ABV2D5J8_9SPHN
MPSVPYWHVDAFADQPFTGNQAAVMLLEEWPDDAVLKAIGEENNFAETAFLVRDTSGTADCELRWFTPKCEIRLCGHATLASGHVLLGLAPQADAVTFRTRKAGILTVRRAGDALEVGLPAIPTTPGRFPEAVALVGAEPLEVWRSPLGYNIFLYSDENSVRALVPDLRGLEALGDDQFIVTARGSGTDVVSRVFVPDGGVDEDSVTGSAHAALTWFWSNKLGKDTLTAFQASTRGGQLSCRLAADVAWLGGPCVTVVEGRFAF